MKNSIKLSLMLIIFIFSNTHGQEIKTEGIKEIEVKKEQAKEDFITYNKTDLSGKWLDGFGFNYEGNFKEKNYPKNLGFNFIMAYSFKNNFLLGLDWGYSPSIGDINLPEENPGLFLKKLETAYYFTPFVRKYWIVEDYSLMPSLDFSLNFAWRNENHLSRELRTKENVKTPNHIFDWGIFIEPGLGCRISRKLLLHVSFGKIGSENISGVGKRENIYHLNFNMKNIKIGLNFLIENNYSWGVL